MEHVEYMREQARKAVDALDQAKVHLNRINNIPRTRIKSDLMRGAAPGTTAADVNGMLGVIDWSRESGAHKLNEAQADIESLCAALDDAIGVAGRLV